MEAATQPTADTSDKLAITKDRVKAWHACSDGYRWFLGRFPQGGQFVESKTTQWRNVVNPATQEVLARVPFATPD
ncbi:hypothetical protein, partial [Neokomagataea anthophila]